MVVEKKEMKSIQSMYKAMSDEYGCNVESYILKYIGFGLFTTLGSMGCCGRTKIMSLLGNAKFHCLYYTGVPLYCNSKVKVFR